MTSAAGLLPRVPQLPHDPLSLRLDARAGFRVALADGAEQSPRDGALSLQPLPGTWPLADDAGTFGALCLPDHVAVGPAGLLLLLDRSRSRLRRFDPCSCSFVDLPCIAGAGAGPRQVGAGASIAVGCGSLFVCDGANHRVAVFATSGLALRALWQTPAGAGLTGPWRPAALVGSGGLCFVADPDHGAVHVLTPTGRFLRTLAGLGAVVHLAADRDGLLYAQVEGDPQVRVVDPRSGRVLELRTRADQVASRFDPLPFPVTSEGFLHLGGLCAEGAGDLFDASGEPRAPGLDDRPLWRAIGSVRTVALDSRLGRCQWDRLELHGSFPAQTRVQALVTTAETELPDDLVAQLPDSAWSPCPLLQGEAGAAPRWDCLLRAPPGRYLWLRLDLAGDGTAAPRIEVARIVFPRVSLRRYLPGVFGQDPVGADFTDRFLALFDRPLRELETTLDQQAHLFDPLSAPATGKRDFLSFLASWLGVPLDRSWPVERRRRYLKAVGKLLPLRGTLEGLRRNLQLYLGLPTALGCGTPHACDPCCQPARTAAPELVLEHYRLRRWMFLGHGRLGDQARLWGESIVNRSRLGGSDPGNAQTGVTRLDATQDPFRDPFHVYAHKASVFVPAALLRSAAAKRGLQRLIAAERPAHVAVQLVPVEARFRIGIQSMIGFDTAIAAPPVPDVRLGEAQLGRATVLGGGGAAATGEARVGSTTRLR